MASRSSGRSSRCFTFALATVVFVALLALAGASLRALAAAPATHAHANATDYVTDHFDNARLGWNPHESQLTTSNVNARDFGLRFTIPVDGQVYAQPLYVHDVAIPGRGRHNVLIVATERDTVYAFDADTGAKLWMRGVAGCCGNEATDVSYVGDCHVSPKIGVSSTPVIDRSSGTIYVVAKAMRRDGNQTTFHHTLHALALESGNERREPAEITGTTTLTDRGVFTAGPSWKHSLRRLLGNTLAFNPRVQYSRTGLLLQDGILYFGYGSHCHDEEAYGWVFAYRASDLKQVASFATVRDWQSRNGGGVWQSGYGISADQHGDLYLTTGNGPFDADEGGLNYGDSALKLSPDLRVVDYFSPYTQSGLFKSNGDFSGSGVILLPDQPGAHPHLALLVSKARAIFLLDRDRLGNYTPNGPDRIVQVIGDEHADTDWCIGTCGGPAYYEGPRGPLVFNVLAQDALRAYRLVSSGTGVPRLVETAHSDNRFPGSGGANPTVSSNGKAAGTGIVWVTTRPNINEVRTRPVELLAYDAMNLGHILYSAPAGLWPNTRGHPFITPTVVNGKVYVAGYDRVSVFGLRR